MSTLLFAIGTYSRDNSKGIYIFELDANTGQLRDTGQSAQAENPSFVVFHRTGTFCTRLTKSVRSRVNREAASAPLSG
jgi:6-phosphogluconolactonase (cycloisomerase 2 family)